MTETLYGRHAVTESLRAGRRRAVRLLLAQGTVQASIVDEMTALAAAHHVPVETVPRHDLQQLASTDQHQGVALETTGYPYASVSEMLDLAQERAEMPLLLLLDLVQDVHNLGSLIRTAEAVGVHGIVIQERRAAGITPATVNTSSGAAEHMLVAQVTNLAQEIESLKETEIWVAGLEDVYGAQLYTEVNLDVPLALVVGSESEGLRRLVRERCDWVMRMPMHGRINSLNAAVAGSVALYEVLRQRSLVS
ncbi:MAG: 23S rRNA (guanosine(2251)-2'-O)-methyltransferase RlmB [Anaerolineae bacterium]|nr:23S rRNA (guanosine(2251)-2'-O)-methyltransferase RlmB [Anaerolineae bacterium]